MKHLGSIAFGILLTVIGLVTGLFMAGSSGAGTGRPTDAHGADAGDVEKHTALAPQTLKNLGVEVDRAVRSDFEVTQKIQAVVVDRPLNHRPVVAPLGGIVLNVHVQTGEFAEGGAALVRIARDPIPRPSLELTADILKPISEDVHGASSRLRVAMSEIAVTQQELERIQPFVENRTIPGKTAIDLRYQLARSEQEARNARMELTTHGLTAEEIEAVATGSPPPRTRFLWRRSLEEAGLWTEVSDAVWEALPVAQRDLPWCVAAIGELSAAGLVSTELANLLKTEPEAPLRFAEAAGLLLQGTPLDTVHHLLAEGALAAQMTVRVPRDGPAEWDVEEILIRPGQRVHAGEVLVRLYDARLMWLRLQPVGREIGLVTRAMEYVRPLRAVPLVEASGPDLSDVRLVRMALQAGNGDRGGLAHAVIENVSLPCAPGTPCRSWQIRVGLRYLVEIPVDTFGDRFVLPIDALTSRGPDEIVFIQNGEEFTAQPVHVEYRDDRVVVIADDGSIYENDLVVMQGAFALGLALQAKGSAPMDPHAGHSHN